MNVKGKPLAGQAKKNYQKKNYYYYEWGKIAIFYDAGKHLCFDQSDSGEDGMHEDFKRNP